jgi:diphosphomevalonate decarboxylase
MNSATAVAHPNLAFIKYWGNKDPILRLPSNGSISINLLGLETVTTVKFDHGIPGDEVFVNEERVSGSPFNRVRQVLDEVRLISDIKSFANVESRNNFPTGTGIASSASAFAALALASSAAAGLELSTRDLSRLARHASGSACRSIPGGFVEWMAGSNDLNSYAESIAPAEHWDLVDCIAVVNRDPKEIGSSEGHQRADSSPIQISRVEDAPRRLDLCRKAIRERDFPLLTKIVEHDSNLLHAVTMTSTPTLYYWQPATLQVMQSVVSARLQGLQGCFSIDAGANVHVICPRSEMVEIRQVLENIPGVLEVLIAGVGGPARLIKVEEANI